MQLDNGRKVPPNGWKCEKCDLRENLWLNLTDGAILCGRRNFDGSGGNNHAVEHYQTTGYPLAVKLGTITPDSAGGVFVDASMSFKIIMVKERIVLREIHLRTTGRHLSMGSHCVICHPTEVTAPPSPHPSTNQV